jgi:hypothetical protein
MSDIVGPESDLDPELLRFLREELGVDPQDAGPWTFTGPIWLWRGKAGDGAADKSSTAWHFLTITGDVAAALRGAGSAAWGSVPVTATIGMTTWKTSLFPSKERGGYLLPVKMAVRKAERVADGDVVTVELQV